jgi:hypothetical protein
MNAPENNPDIENVPRLDDGDDYEDLRRQITLIFGALIISSFTLTAYLGLQARRASVELINIKPRETEAIKMVDQDNAAVQSVYGKLADFGRTHPDFEKQILSKYKVSTNMPPGMKK